MVQWEVEGGVTPDEGFEHLFTSQSTGTENGSTTTSTADTQHTINAGTTVNLSFSSNIEGYSSEMQHGTSDSSSSSINASYVSTISQSSLGVGGTGTGTRFATTASFSISESFSEIGQAAGTTIIIPFVGGTTWNSNSYSMTSSYSSRNGATIRNTTFTLGTTSLTTITSSTQTTSSTSTTTSSTFSTTETFESSFSGSNQTTSTSEFTETGTSWSTASELTFIHTTYSTTADDGTTVTIYSTGLTETSFENHVTADSITSYTFLRTYTDYVQTEGDDTYSPLNARNTRIMANVCHALWTAGPIFGTERSCDIFAEDAGPIEFSPFYTQLSITDAGANDSFTFWFFVESFQTGVDYPVPYGEFKNIGFQAPGFVSGYRPWSAVQSDKAIYSSYSIDLPFTVSGTDFFIRQIGTTFDKGRITDVLTLNSEDTLVMMSEVTSSTDTIGAAAGGFPGRAGQITMVQNQGVYSITEYNVAGDISVYETTVTPSESSTTIPEGNVYAWESIDAYVPTAGWPTNEKTFVMEIPCQTWN
jgi:hypothetical protein